LTGFVRVGLRIRIFIAGLLATLTLKMDSFAEIPLGF
jgi:hypothetical protein